MRGFLKQCLEQQYNNFHERIVAYNMNLLRLFPFKVTHRLAWMNYWKFRVSHSKKGNQAHLLGITAEKYEEILEEIVAKTKVEEDDFAVDFGCGTGKLLHFLREKYNIQGIGIDLSKDAVEWGTKIHPGLIIKRGDITDAYCIPNNVADLTICHAVLPYLYDLQDVCIAISEMVRVTKKHGSIVLTYMGGKNARMRPDCFRIDKAFWTNAPSFNKRFNSALYVESVVDNFLELCPPDNTYSVFLRRV